ncbi:hypothetical protein JCM1840_001945 [Sporobolomyces johnsonii]
MTVHLQPAPPANPPSVLSATFSPSSSSLALFPSPTSFPTPSTTKSRQLVYFAFYGQPLVESRDFIAHTYTLFASLQKIVHDYEADANADPANFLRAHASNVPQPPEPEQVQYYARVSRLYRQAIVKQLPLIEANPSLSPSAKAHALEHHATMHAVLALAEILYLPADGRGEGVVGEELLDWVNTVDRAPSAEEGTALLASPTPWQDPNFFPYLTRCILRGHLASSSALLALLVSQHPSAPVQSLAKLCADLIDTYPRSTAFKTEQAFRVALKAFQTTLVAAQKTSEKLFAALSTDPTLDSDDDERADFSSSFRTLLSLLSGDQPTILESSDSWFEALAAYCVWANPTATREDLPSVLDLVSRELPVDATLPGEAAQAALVRGDVPGVLKALTGGPEGGEFAWLATHLADLLSHLHLAAFEVPATTNASEGDERDALGPRELFLLDWADRLTVDEGLWRVSCGYWGECGEVGRARIGSAVRGVRLTEEEREEGEGGDGMDVEGEGEGEAGEEGKKGQGRRRVEEVLRVCSEYGLEDDMVSICEVRVSFPFSPSPERDLLTPPPRPPQSYAELLTAQSRYGEAISFCVRANNSKKIARIADRILDEYVANGQEAFIHHVDSLPTSLLRPSSPPSSPSSRSRSPSPVPALPSNPRLSFLARYRDFFALYARGDRRAAAELLVLLLTSGVAPRGFWAVMMLDILPLLETQPPLVSLAETYELLRILDELTGPIEMSRGRDVFGVLEMLARLLEGGGRGKEKEKEKEKRGQHKEGKDQDKGEGEGGNARERTQRAMKQLEVVRGALARHLGLCCCL